MSNGGEETLSLKPNPDEFGRAVSRVAVAQICETLGFQGFKNSALDSLTDIAIRYLLNFGKLAQSHANLSGRTQCNFFDVIRGFEDMSAQIGFQGSLGSDNCVISSGFVKEIIRFVESNEEVPCAQPVPPFPVVRESRLIPSFSSMNETPAGKYIPTWLPAFPDLHTYRHTPMWNERVVDPRSEKIELARQRRKAERALLSLQQRLLSNSLAGTSTSGAVNCNGKKLRAGESNSVISTPLEPGEKAVPAVVLPDRLKNSVPLIEAFAPAIESAKEGGFADVQESEKKLLPEKRPAVNFKFKTGKKMLGEPLDLALSRKSGGLLGHWLGREDERDDKKRRAEFILRQAMENPQELTQL